MVFRFATFDPAQDPDDFNPAFPPTPSSSPLVTYCQPCEHTYTFTRTLVSRLVAAGASLVFTVPASESHDDENRDQYAETPFHCINLDVRPEYHQRKLKNFTLEELKEATRNFSDEKIIGRGGFGAVYEGRLAGGTLVAIKRKYDDGYQGTSEFQSEVTAGSIIPPRHNLVPLLGFCRTRKSMDLLFVYPLMINKSLGCYLTERPERQPPLDWLTRIKIALGTARGLCCLHDLNIVHLDIKPHNILLDEKFEPHIGDFGLVKFTDRKRSGYSVDGIEEAPVLPTNESEARSHSEDFNFTKRICGTFGYMPPEYAMKGEYSGKTDVFAFGIMLLELVTGRKKVIRVNDGSVSLRNWVKGLVIEDSWESGVDPNLQGEYDREETEKVIRLALLCTRKAPRARPSMAQVVRTLEGHSTDERWEEYRRSDEYLISSEIWGEHVSSSLISFQKSSGPSPEELSGPR